MMAVYSQQLQVYYVNNDPEANDKLYVRWIGGVRFLPPETDASSIVFCARVSCSVLQGLVQQTIEGALRNC